MAKYIVKFRIPKWTSYIHLAKIIYTVFFRKLFFFEFGNPNAQYIRPKITVHKGEETIQGRKLFKGGNCMRKNGK